MTSSTRRAAPLCAPPVLKRSMVVQTIENRAYIAACTCWRTCDAQLVPCESCTTTLCVFRCIGEHRSSAAGGNHNKTPMQIRKTQSGVNLRRRLYLLVHSMVPMNMNLHGLKAGAYHSTKRIWTLTSHEIENRLQHCILRLQPVFRFSSVPVIARFRLLRPLCPAFFFS